MNLLTGRLGGLTTPRLVPNPSLVLNILSLLSRMSLGSEGVSSQYILVHIVVLLPVVLLVYQEVTVNSEGGSCTFHSLATVVSRRVYVTSSGGWLVIIPPLVPFAPLVVPGVAP